MGRRKRQKGTERGHCKEGRARNRQLIQFLYVTAHLARAFLKHVSQMVAFFSTPKFTDISKGHELHPVS